MSLPGSPTPTPDRPLPVAPAAPDTGDWPKQATDSIVRVVDTVRDKTAGPAVKAARGIVYGSIITVLCLPLLIFALAAFMRGFERAFIKLGEVTGWSFLDEPMWLVYLLFGAVFFLLGRYFWARAQRPVPVTA